MTSIEIRSTEHNKGYLWGDTYYDHALREIISRLKLDVKVVLNYYFDTKRWRELSKLEFIFADRDITWCLECEIQPAVIYAEPCHHLIWCTNCAERLISQTDLKLAELKLQMIYPLWKFTCPVHQNDDDDDDEKEIHEFTELHHCWDARPTIDQQIKMIDKRGDIPRLTPKQLKWAEDAMAAVERIRYWDDYPQQVIWGFEKVLNGKWGITWHPLLMINGLQEEEEDIQDLEQVKSSLYHAVI